MVSLDDCIVDDDLLLPCARCGRRLPDEAFYRASGNVGRRQRHSWCKTCVTADVRQRRTADPDRARILGRKHARLKRLRRYGMTPADYDAMVEAQGGVCAICGRPEASHPSFAVDHDHATGRVRGLLCFLCNTALGKMGDNPERLRAAADYIERGRPW